MPSREKPSLTEAVHDAAQSAAPGQRPWQPKGETKSLILRLPVDLHRQLRQHALDQDTTLQALGVKALQDLLSGRE